MHTAKSWGHVCGHFRFAELTLPREGVKKGQLAFTDDEVRMMIAAASEPFSTIVAITAALGLRIGETLGLRVCDLDFTKHLIRVRQSVDSASRTIGGVKSRASSADLSMLRELETRLRTHLTRHDGKSELLFVNRKGAILHREATREEAASVPRRTGDSTGRFSRNAARRGVCFACRRRFAGSGAEAIAPQRPTLAVYVHVLGDQQRTAVQNRSARLEAISKPSVRRS
jgi:integrase